MTTHKKFAAAADSFGFTDAASPCPSILLRLSSASATCDASPRRDKRPRLAKPNRPFSPELQRPATKSMRIGNVTMSVVAAPASVHDKASAVHAHGRIDASPAAAETPMYAVPTSSGCCAVAADPRHIRIAANRAASAVERGCTPLPARDDVGDALSVLFLSHGVFGRRKYSRVLFLPVIPTVPVAAAGTVADAASEVNGSCWHARKYLYNLGSRYHRG